MDAIITPTELRKTAEAKEMARAREIFEAEKRRADERLQLREAFMNREIEKSGARSRACRCRASRRRTAANTPEQQER